MAFTWDTPSSGTDLMTTSLNSLAAGTTIQSGTITPATTYPGRKFYIEFALILAAPASSWVLSSWSLSILRAVDDTPTNFSDYLCTDPVFTFWVPAGSAAIRRIATPELRAPGRPFQVALTANSGATTLASSGNILRYWTNTET